MSKHTPGPWRLNDTFKSKVFAQTEKGLMTICDIRGWGHLTGVGGFHLSDDRAIEIQDANAGLIAAAPELLEALRDIIARCDAGLQISTGDYMKAASAIEKATT